MDRRRFLMGMGAFAGAALVVPKAATIFDMGAHRGLVLPEGFGESGFVTAMRISQLLHPNQITLGGVTYRTSNAWADMQEYDVITKRLKAVNEFRAQLAARLVPRSFEFIDPMTVYPRYEYDRLTGVSVRR